MNRCYSHWEVLYRLHLLPVELCMGSRFSTYIPNALSASSANPPEP